MSPAQPYLLGLAGATCAGKTSLAQRLAQALDRLSAVVFRLDDYYLDLAHLPFAQRAARNFDLPEALDWEMLLPHLDGLRQGRPVERPVYDFARHTRRAETIRLSPGRVVIVEGLHCLDPRLEGLLDLAVLLEVDRATALARRLARDQAERGRSEEEARRRFETQAWPGYEEFVLSRRDKAGLIFGGDEDMDSIIRRVVEEVEKRLG